MGRYSTYYHDEDETAGQLTRMDKLIAAYNTMSEEAISKFSLWLEGGNPYPQDKRWSALSRRDQAEDLIQWLDRRIQQERESL